MQKFYGTKELFIGADKVQRSRCEMCLGNRKIS